MFLTVRAGSAIFVIKYRILGFICAVCNFVGERFTAPILVLAWLTAPVSHQKRPLRSAMKPPEDAEGFEHSKRCYAASWGIASSTNRKNRVLRVRDWT
jgi:hypothetical protein